MKTLDRQIVLSRVERSIEGADRGGIWALGRREDHV